ncbi:MAG: hypothetical protein Q9M25_06435 [Mariprofundaceae bacterium]|nr:hypothetical protein [Mariprofundaceae bacterium]
MLKRSLIELEQKELLGLIRDLYSASKENQSFLHARFSLGQDTLEPYKLTIKRWICPDVMRNQSYSISKAKKAISDYRRATGRPDGMAELAVCYCESCADFLDYCGMDDEGYFDAMVRMYEEALKVICQLEEKQQETFVERLEQVRFRENHSWNPIVASEMRSLMEQYRFDERG